MSPALPQARSRARSARTLGIVAGVLGLGWISARGGIACVCPLDRPEVEGGGWVVPVEGLQTGLFADVTIAAMGDVDGDGIGDVAVGLPEPNEGLSRIHLLSGRDGARLRSWTVPDARNRRLGRRLLAVGDVDGGGRRDLATSAGGGVVVLSTESGARLFEPPDLEGWVFELRDAGDVDGDGLVDLGLCFERPYPRVEVRSGADGAFLLEIATIAPARFPVVNELDRRWVVCGLGDVDGDGLGDCAVGSAPGWSSDDPVSTRHIGLVAAISGRTGAELWVVPGEIDLDRWPSDLARLADRDGDRVPELAIGSRGRIELRSGRTGELLLAQEGPPRTDWGASVREAGDVDGDGTADLLAFCENPDVFSGRPFPTGGYFELLSGRELELLQRSPLACSVGTDEVQPAGDLDGDGRADLVLGFPVADRSGVDFLCCDNLRAPKSWVALMRGLPTR